MNNNRVYFVQAITGGPIKIGIAQSLRHRISSLQTSSPVELVILAHMPGYEEEEYALHQKLAAHRIRGEWFQPHPEVLAEVAAALQHDQAIPSEKFVRTDEQIARAAETEKFLISTFQFAIHYEFGEKPDYAHIASLAGIDPRTVKNWLKNGALPHLVNCVNLARNCDTIKYWWIMTTAAGFVALRCKITEYEAIKVLQDNMPVVMAIMSRATNEECFPLVDAAYQGYLNSKDLPLWGAI